MRIRDVMTSPVVTIEPDASSAEARARMRGRDIHHLVVTRRGHPCGVLSARDVGGRGGLGSGPRAKVEECMTPLAITVASDTTLRTAAGVMRGRGIGCLPVVDRDVLVGIVTISDLLGLLADGALPSLTAERRLRSRRTAAIRAARTRA